MSEADDQIFFDPNVIAELREDIPWQFKKDGDDVANALHHACGTALQVYEEQAFNVMMGTSLGLAVGDALDQWGSLVGEKRVGLGNDDYRRIIHGRIKARASRGKISDLWELTSFVTETDDVRIVEVYPAGLIIEYTVTDPLSAAIRRRIAAIIGAAIAGGVGYQIIEAVDPAFGFDENPTAAGFGVGGYSTIIGAST